ncbi:thiamine phosphate synthase [Bacillus sp. T3]|uniref:thiamine phosphate synthase n=1 Tax=Bacillus sp. T3 TaxID=467262 RepID=UPI002980DF7E|nr:thiamine phosphate synthase [Bacillus sp. T3]
MLFNIPNVQLPGHGLPVALVKNMYPLLTVGRSVHSFEEAKQAEIDGADYVVYGHCFETNCKRGKPANGLTLLEEMVKKLCIPVYGIGGITPERVGLMQKAGAAGVAMMSGIFSSIAPADTARHLFEKVRRVSDENKF